MRALTTCNSQRAMVSRNHASDYAIPQSFDAAYHVPCLHGVGSQYGCRQDAILRRTSCCRRKTQGMSALQYKSRHTVVLQVVVHLQVDLCYLKPVQTGFPKDSDARLVVSLHIASRATCPEPLLPTIDECCIGCGKRCRADHRQTCCSLAERAAATPGCC